MAQLRRLNWLLVFLVKLLTDDNLVEYRVYQSKMDETKDLRDRRINIFVELWYLVALRSLDIWVSSICFKKKVTLAGLIQPPTERVSYISAKWNFDDPFHKKGPVLVIWVPGMIQASGSVKILMKWDCRGHWGHWGCWGCWGH